jgi:hypothetical protein
LATSTQTAIDTLAKMARSSASLATSTANARIGGMKPHAIAAVERPVASAPGPVPPTHAATKTAGKKRSVGDGGMNGQIANCMNHAAAVTRTAKT